MTDQELDLRRNLFSGQLDRVNRIGAAVVANELGLDPVEFAPPFPGNQSITIHKYPESQPVAAAKPLIRKGLSTAAAIGIGLLTAAVPAAGVVGYLLNSKVVEKSVEKIIKQPGTNYDVDVEMEVIPPK